MPGARNCELVTQDIQLIIVQLHMLLTLMTIVGMKNSETKNQRNKNYRR